MTVPSNTRSWRRLLLAGSSLLALAACGGGSCDDVADPSIRSFPVDGAWVQLGERLRLTASFRDSEGPEDWPGALRGGLGVEPAVPDRGFRFTLLVERSGVAAPGRTLPAITPPTPALATPRNAAAQ